MRGTISIAGGSKTSSSSAESATSCCVFSSWPSGTMLTVRRRYPWIPVWQQQHHHHQHHHHHDQHQQHMSHITCRPRDECTCNTWMSHRFHISALFPRRAHRKVGGCGGCGGHGGRRCSGLTAVRGGTIYQPNPLPVDLVVRLVPHIPCRATTRSSESAHWLRQSGWSGRVGSGLVVTGFGVWGLWGCGGFTEVETVRPDHVLHSPPTHPLSRRHHH